jgi:hypothetical protein
VPGLACKYLTRLEMKTSTVKRLIVQGLRMTGANSIEEKYLFFVKK